MTFLQYLSVFRLYSVSTLLLALGVTLFTSLLKKTVLKNASKKLFVFLPFVLGVLVYGGYQAILKQSLLPFTEEFCETMEGGMATGSVATLYYIVYEQFLRKKTEDKVSPFYGILAGLVPEERRSEIALETYETAKDLPENEISGYLAKALADGCDSVLSPEELNAYVKLMKNVLHSLAK